MIKKRYLIVLSGLIIAGLALSVCQYANTLKTEVINAATTKPNPGHSWTEMESDSDSIQVNGQTITNLASPVNNTDAATKAYVDAAGSAVYNDCYVVSSTTAGLGCNTGYTAIFWEQNGCWQNSGPYAGTGAGLTFNMGGPLVIQPGWAIDANVNHWGEGGSSSVNYGGKGTACRTSAGSCYSTYESRCAPMLLLNGNAISGPIVTWPASHSFGLCCK